MNERIRELAEQAYEQQPLMVANRETFEIEHKIGHGGAPMYHRVFNQEKFAELIVQECIEQVTTGPNGPAHYAVEAALRLKKHFGVEE